MNTSQYCRIQIAANQINRIFFEPDILVRGEGEGLTVSDEDLEGGGGRRDCWNG